MTLKLEVIPQITESHCGPAVLQMLLKYYGNNINQDDVVIAARVKSSIMRYGMRPTHLARAVNKLNPNLKFWFKNKARVSDIDVLINHYKTPVGIDWQSLFYDSPEEEKRENPNGDFGHYSIVIGIDRKKDKIVIADPYFDYAPKKRHFKLSWFVKRWWDAARDIHPKTKEVSLLKTKRMLFVLAQSNNPIIQELKLLPASKLDTLYLPNDQVIGFKDIFPYYKV